MIWIILFIISVPIFGYIMYRKNDNDVETGIISSIGYFMCGGFVTVIFTMLLSLLVCTQLDVAPNDEYIKRDLTALSDGFFLGANKNYYYTYYAGDSKTGYKQYTARVENSLIFEDATPGTAYVTVHEDKSENRFWYFYIGDDNKYEFHIPAGSILRNYELG